MLAGLINALELGALPSGYSLDRIDVTANDRFTVHAVVEVRAILGVSAGLNKIERFNVLPERLKVSVPVCMDYTTPGTWRIEGITEESCGVDESEIRHIINSLASVNTTVNSVRSDLTTSIMDVMLDNGLKFVYEENEGVQNDEKTGLSFPALTEMFVKVLNRDSSGVTYSIDDMNTLFDDFICLRPFESTVDVSAGKAHFTDHMVENYYMKENELPHATEDEIDSTFRKLLLALDLTSPNEGETAPEMYELLDPDRIDQNVILNSKKVIFGEDELTAIFREIAEYGLMHVTEVHVPENGAITIIGDINMESFMPETMSDTMVALAPHTLSIKMTVLTDGSRTDYVTATDSNENDVYYHYEIMNLNTYESGDEESQRRLKTNNIIETFDIFGADIHADDFGAFAVAIRESVDLMFDKLRGQATDGTRVDCELVHDYVNDGSVADSTITSGVIMPSLREYATARGWIDLLTA